VSQNTAVWLNLKKKPFIADDHCRVKLLELYGDPPSDYINASYIKVRTYIKLIKSI